MSDAPRHRAHAPGDIIPFGGGWVRLVESNNDGTWRVHTDTKTRNYFTISLKG